jgi:hypothetical protein
LAIGVGWSVVKHENGLARMVLAQSLVDVFLLPLLYLQRLALGQIAAHGEWCVGQVEGLAVVAGRGGVGHLDRVNSVSMG